MSAKQIPIHADYVDATVRTFTPCCPLRGRHGISFDVPPYGVLRFAITPESAAFLRLCLDDYMSAEAGSQSPMSRLMSSEPMSVPSEGDQVCPPATSSIAATADG